MTATWRDASGTGRCRSRARRRGNHCRHQCKDLGGPENVTNAQRVILSGLRLSLLVQGLAEFHIKATGVVNPKTRKTNSLLTVAATFINSARLGAVALGLGRVARNVTNSLDAAMREIAEREHGNANEDQPKN